MVHLGLPIQLLYSIHRLSDLRLKCQPIGLILLKTRELLVQVLPLHTIGMSVRRPAATQVALSDLYILGAMRRAEERHSWCGSAVSFVRE